MAIATLLVAALGTAGIYVSSSDGSSAESRSLTAVPVAANAAPVTTAPAPAPPPPPPTTAPPVTTMVVRPVTTIAAPTTTAAPAPPAPARPAATRSSADRCAEALSWAASHGLALPSDWSFRCPGPVGSGAPGQYWGRACMNLVGECPGTAFVAVDVDLIGPNDATLHYVVAHEICHAIELQTTKRTTEEAADACAAAHGAPRNV